WVSSWSQAPSTRDAIWVDLQYARDVLEQVVPDDFSHALADLYCASYRWHLACTSPALSNTSRHREAEASAMDEVRSACRSKNLSGSTIPAFKWCS
ncbi:MAG: hypothetical protein AAFX99_10465, partial [Myxococcota bacterium]